MQLSLKKLCKKFNFLTSKHKKPQTGWQAIRINHSFSQFEAAIAYKWLSLVSQKKAEHQH